MYLSTVDQTVRAYRRTHDVDDLEMSFAYLLNDRFASRRLPKFDVFVLGPTQGIRSSIGSFGCVTAVFMYLSTVDQTVRAYRRTHDVDDLEMSFAYLFNALIWLVYAALPKFDVFVLGPTQGIRSSIGSFGCVTAVFMYLSTVDQTVRAYRRTHDVDDLEMSFAYLFNALIWLVYAALPKFDVFVLGPTQGVRSSIGSFGCVTAVFMYLSTVDQTVRAYRTHDVDDLKMSFAYLFNALIWLVYAALPKFDVFVLSSSILGVLATGYQAFLWVRYQNAPILQNNVVAGIAMSGGLVQPPVVPPANDPLVQRNAGIAEANGAAVAIDQASGAAA
ncbi:hypothetical protein ZWY2020_026716 [Hordeum vulgare]|nr:hypothetical protein ZWY2020_026716 [Hordeum vulgare]